MAGDDRSLWERIADRLAGVFQGDAPASRPPLSFPRDTDNPAPTEARDLDYDDHGPYPRDWDQATRDFWDNEPNTVRDLYTRDEWRDLQTAFHYGWVATGMTRDEHERWRDVFYRISNIAPSGFDWDEAREYWADVSGTRAA